MILILIDQFDFALPEHLIAQSPLAERSASRLLILDKQNGTIRHGQFPDFIDQINSRDLIVMNDTKVLPARLFGRKKDTGANIEILLHKDLGNNRWEVLAKPAKRLKLGNILHFGNHLDAPRLTAIVEELTESGERVISFQYTGIFMEILEELGEMPLPPYIKQKIADNNRYQTVYAKQVGSVAAPTAGLHFTEALLEQIRHKGVQIANVTLHVGLGTFRPVMAEQVEQHRMHAEYYQVPSQTVQAIQQTRAAGGRIIAIGTTSARTLETAASQILDGVTGDLQGWTDIFIYPGVPFRLVDGLLTNFHLPKSTLIMMIAALAGTENILNAYQEAIKQEYRFFSFGDAMFIS